jgi:hypothetical protein
MKKQIIITVWAALMLAACTHDDSQLANFNGPVAVTFTGVVNQTPTRATANWPSTITSIGISAVGVSSYQNVEYTVETDEDASLTFTTQNPYYFQTTKESTEFVAYAPSTLTVADDYTIAVTTDVDYAEDILTARTSSLDYSSCSKGPVKLTFEHKLAKVQLTAELGSSISNGTVIKGVELTNIVNSGTVSLSSDDVSLNKDKTLAIQVEGNETETYTILPQDGILVTVTTQNDGTKNTYQTPLGAIEAGYSYSFTVTAENSELGVKATIEDWEETVTGSLDTAMPIPTFGDFTDPDQTFLYDLVFSDGSFKHTTASNGGDFISDLDLTDIQKSEVRGIIFNRDDYTSYDNSLKEDYSNCTHGLIVALNDATSSTSWMDSTFPEIATSTYGYESTKFLQAYNDSESNDAKKIKPLIYLAEYAEKYPSPSNCSTWYLMNEEKYKLLAYNYSNINTCLSKLNSLGVKANELNGRYWLAYMEGSGYALCVIHGSSTSVGASYISEISTKCAVRAICAY